jgi:hypothetical protein
MILQWFKKLAREKFIKTMRGEADSWITSLRSLDAEEIAGVLAIALTQAAFLRAQLKAEPYEPQLTVIQHPNICITLNSAIRHLQKEGMPQPAAGMFVWLFTFRAAMFVELRDTGRQLWKELSRGEPHVPTAAAQFAAVGFDVSIEDWGRVPTGMTHEPLP